MANPTTNYGWPMPTSSDLVTDLPADFDAFGQPVDTTLKALNPETTLGDISYRSAVSNTNTRLGIGTAGQVLAVSGGVPAWTTTADVTRIDNQRRFIYLYDRRRKNWRWRRWNSSHGQAPRQQD
jgi:hypothetical protein